MEFLKKHQYIAFLAFVVLVYFAVQVLIKQPFDTGSCKPVDFLPSLKEGDS